jgi:hypothetical protein
MNRKNYVGQLSDEIYFARPELSNSGLSAFEREIKGLDEPNHAPYRVGSLFDAMSTTPELVNSLTLTANGKEYSDEEFSLCHSMFEHFKTTRYWELCQGISQACFAGPITVDMGGFHSTVQMRCKVDILNDLANANIEIKTTVATSQEQFERAIEQFSYDRAGAIYTELAEVDKHFIIGVGKHKTKRQVFPYLIRRGDETYERGKEKYENLLYRYVMLYGNIEQAYLNKQ